MKTQYEIQNRHPNTGAWQKTAGVPWLCCVEQARNTVRDIESGRIKLTHPGAEYRIVRYEFTVIGGEE
jgi:hypothetical protein